MTPTEAVNAIATLANLLNNKAISENKTLEMEIISKIEGLLKLVL